MPEKNKKQNKKPKEDRRSLKKERKKQKKERRLSKNKKVKIFFGDALFFLAGSILFSISVNMFTAPNGIAPGGVTGVSTLINHLFGLPIGMVMIAINIPLFILAFIFLGKKFLFKTAIATLMLSVAIDFSAPFIPVYEGDRILASLFGGLLSGAALGGVFIRGATTGGADILVKLLRKRFPHMAMGTIYLMLDVAVVALAGFVYKSIESMLYAIIVFFVSSRVINFLLYGTGNGKMIMAVTDRADEIAGAITSETRRGATIMPVQGGYTGEQRKMLLCVVRANEVAGIRKIILRFDGSAFVIISEAGEILGLGFKSLDSE